MKHERICGLFYISKLYKFMSIMKSIAVFLLSGIFVLSLFMSITSYTIGGLLQKDNLKDFIASSMASDLIDNQCNNLCSDVVDEKQNCLEMCREEISSQTDQNINDVIDNIYETDFYGVSINQITLLLNQLVLFVAITLVSGIVILYLSEEPLSTLGRNMLSVSITLFITAMSPNFILSLSNVPVQSVFSEYMFQGLEQQKIFAAVLLVVAIVFIAAQYLLSKKKKKAKKSK